MVGWHHQLIGHEFEQAPRVGDGQGSLACCGSWNHEELDTTEQINEIELIVLVQNLLSKSRATSLFPYPI